MKRNAETYLSSSASDYSDAYTVASDGSNISGGADYGEISDRVVVGDGGRGSDNIGDVSDITSDGGGDRDDERDDSCDPFEYHDSVQRKRLRHKANVESTIAAGGVTVSAQSKICALCRDEILVHYPCDNCDTVTCLSCIESYIERRVEAVGDVNQCVNKICCFHCHNNISFTHLGRFLNYGVITRLYSTAITNILLREEFNRHLVTAVLIHENPEAFYESIPADIRENMDYSGMYTHIDHRCAVQSCGNFVVNGSCIGCRRKYCPNCDKLLPKPLHATHSAAVVPMATNGVTSIFNPTGAVTPAVTPAVTTPTGAGSAAVASEGSNVGSDSGHVCCPEALASKHYIRDNALVCPGCRTIGVVDNAEVAMYVRDHGGVCETVRCGRCALPFSKGSKCALTNDLTSSRLGAHGDDVLGGVLNETSVVLDGVRFVRGADGDFTIATDDDANELDEYDPNFFMVAELDKHLSFVDHGVVDIPCAMPPISMASNEICLDKMIRGGYLADGVRQIERAVRSVIPGFNFRAVFKRTAYVIDRIVPDLFNHLFMIQQTVVNCKRMAASRRLFLRGAIDESKFRKALWSHFRRTNLINYLFNESIAALARIENMIVQIVPSAAPSVASSTVSSVAPSTMSAQQTEIEISNVEEEFTRPTRGVMDWINDLRRLESDIIGEMRMLQNSAIPRVYNSWGTVIAHNLVCKPFKYGESGSKNSQIVEFNLDFDDSQIPIKFNLMV